MKYIISTTGEKIKFSINRNRNLVIDTVVPTEVSIAEYELLNTRLGHQIRHVDPLTGEVPKETPVEEIPVVEQPSSPVILTHADEETVIDSSVETTPETETNA